jgi:predicted PurR-regulated permease PerM
MTTTLPWTAFPPAAEIPVVAFGLLAGVLSGVLAMPDQDAIPGDPVPDDPPAAPAPAALSAGGPVPGNFSAKSALHLRTAGTALFNWWRAVTIEGLCVAVLWLIGLLLLKVPLAPVWALIAGLMTLVPNIGGVIALLGPAFSILVSQPDMYRLCFLLGMYAVIVVIDQLMLQPLIMKRVTRVPVWASILVPIVLGIVIPFWGILLAPPLLAVVYAFRRPRPRSLP